MKDTDTRRRIGIRTALLALTVLALATAPLTAGQDLSDLMRLKLDRAQSLFEAVVLARFSAIERYAGDLARISEQSVWTPQADATYLQHAGEFQEAARSLRQAAADRNMDEVSIAYMTLTSSCVQCHQFLRESRLAEHHRAPEFPMPGASAAHALGNLPF